MIDFTYYIFAFYIFILVIAAIIITKKINGNTAGNANSYYEKEKKLFKLYQNLEDMITSTEEYMEETKNEVAADKKRILQIKKQINHIYRDSKSKIKSKEVTDNIPQKEKPVTEIKEVPKEPETEMDRNEKVCSLKDKGMDAEQISKELGISKGEVVLILNFYKK